MLTTKKRLVPFPVWSLVLMGLILFTGCTPSGPAALLQGERLIRQGEYRPAIQSLEEATRLLPRNAQAWNHLGLAYHGAGRFEEAIRAYQQSLALDRNLAVAHYNLGCLHLEQNNLPAALAALTSYTGLQPNAPAGWVKLGTVQLRSRQLDAAEKAFSQALRLNPHQPEALNGLGIVHVQRRRYPDALRHFNTALREQPDYAPALLNSAVVSQQHLTNRVFALQKYREFLALRPSSTVAGDVQRVAVQLELELRPPTRPVATHPPSIATTTNPPSPVAQVTHKPGTSLTAARPVTAPAATQPVVSPPPARLAGLTSPPAPRGSTATSPPATRAELPASPPARIDVVQVSEDEPVKPALDPPGNASAQPAAPGTAPAQAAGIPGSEQEKTALSQRLNPRNWFRSRENPTASRPSSGTDPASGNVDQALTRSTSPATQRTPIERYRYLSPPPPRAGNRPEAERILNQGLRAQEQNRLSEAMDAYRKAVLADPSFFEAHYNLGVAAYEAGDLSQSLRAYEHALAVEPQSIKARFNLAIALQKAHHPLDAAGELEKLLASRPEEARAHFTLANLCAQELDLPQKAREHYRRVLELEPRHAQATAIRFWLEANP